MMFENYFYFGIDAVLPTGYFKNFSFSKFYSKHDLNLAHVQRRNFMANYVIFLITRNNIIFVTCNRCHWVCHIHNFHTFKSLRVAHFKHSGFESKEQIYWGQFYAHQISRFFMIIFDGFQRVWRRHKNATMAFTDRKDNLFLENVTLAKMWHSLLNLQRLLAICELRIINMHFGCKSGLNQNVFRVIIDKCSQPKDWMFFRIKDVYRFF